MDGTQSIQAIPPGSMPRPDDVVVVGYPKSGNNVLLFRLVRLLHGRRMDWATKGDWIQAVGAEEPPEPLDPRVIWTHETDVASYPRVVYVVRDPRDVVVSFHHHQLRYYGPSGWDESFATFFDAFLEGASGPASWAAHVEGWLGRGPTLEHGFHLTRYEDLIGRPWETTVDLSRFLGGDLSDAAIGDAIEWSSFDNMHLLEHRQRAHLDWAAPGATRPVDGSIPFVRAGRAGAWRTTLTDDQRDRMWSRWGTTMARLGYSA